MNQLCFTLTEKDIVRIETKFGKQEERINTLENAVDQIEKKIKVLAEENLKNLDGISIISKYILLFLL